MSVPLQHAFDQIAAHYDELWSTAPAGVHQRRAVWSAIEPLFRKGEIVLDVGCGTGVDARYLLSNGMNVEAVDASAEMVKVARSKGIQAWQLAAEELPSLGRVYDGALSNFGVLNCVHNLEHSAQCFARVIRPGGWLAICVIGACCFWETCHFLKRKQFGKAFRRWSGMSQSSLGFCVKYPRVRQIRRAFQRHFRLRRWKGIGVAVPPSYVEVRCAAQMARYAKVDGIVSAWPLLRATADHRLLLFERI